MVVAFAVALALAVGASGCAHGDAPPVRGAEVTVEAGEVAFTLTSDNNIVIPAVLNGVDGVNLMLHTANLDVRITEAAVGRATTLRFAGAAEVGSWGGGGTSRVSKGNRLAIGPWEQGDVTVWEDKNSGRDSDGKFGLDFFAGKIVELDFRRRRLAVHERLPGKAAGFARLALDDDNGDLFVSANCVIDGVSYGAKFLVHSGYGGGVLLADEFAASSGADGKIAVTENTVLTDSFGNRIEVRKGVLPELVIGGARLANVPVGFFSPGANMQKISVIGGEVLKRFHLIFDVAHQALYIAPRAS